MAASDDHIREGVLEDAAVSDRVAAIDISLHERLDGDERLTSGVPREQRPTDLDFIQMTGLTRPLAELELETNAASDAGAFVESEEEATSGISFFEKGVEDVDAAMSPPELNDLNKLFDELAPESPALRNESQAAPPSPPPPPNPAISRNLSDDYVAADPLAMPPPEAFDDAESHESADELAELTQLINAITAEAAKEDSPEAGSLAIEQNEPPAVEPAPEIPAVARETEDAPRMSKLAEAEQLLHELESQPRELALEESPSPEDDIPIPPPATVSGRTNAASLPAAEPPFPEPPEERDASVYRQPMSKRRSRRSRRQQSRTWRHMMRWLVRACAAALILAACVAGYWEIQPLLATPAQTLEAARQFESSGQYREAAATYQRFMAANPNSPEKAEAQFSAACCLQMLPTASFDEAQAARREALEAFSQFVAEYPSHAKAARAKVRMAVLQYDLGQYKEAIELLQDPGVQLADPESALPALRTLARARWKTGDYDAAVSAYLQAASLTGNYTADADYEELGDLFRARADHAESDSEREALRKQAIEQWNKAIRVPTVDPTAKGKIAEKIKWVTNQLAQDGSTENAAASAKPASETKPEVAAPAENPAEPAAEAAPTGPAPQEELHYPGAEAAPAPATSGS